MSTATKWILGLVVAALVLIVGAVALGVMSFIPIRVDSGDAGDPAPTETPAIADGRWFGFVTVGEDETGAVVLGIDLAEMLTGEPARRAAIEAGVITEDEDLPNDFFIDNPETIHELVPPASDAEFIVIPADDTAGQLLTDVDGLTALSDGTWTGPDVYGIVPGSPIAMELTIEDGRVTEAVAVYLP